MLSFGPLGGAASPVLDLTILILVAFGAGAIGALLGVGGGLFLVPALVLLFGVDIHLAVAASLVSVVATSSGAGATYLGEGLSNLKLGMFLETATGIGGLGGAIVAVTVLARRSDVLIFAIIPVLLVAAVLMAIGRRRDVHREGVADPRAERLGLGGVYVDPQTHEREEYKVTRTREGLAISSLAGLASGLLGVGGGVFKVPAMNAFMNVPFRIASATSTLMIGVTASAGAIVYLFAGDVALGLVAPVALAVLGGSAVGTHLGSGTTTRRLRWLFVAVLILDSILMALRGVGAIS